MKRITGWTAFILMAGISSAVFSSDLRVRVFERGGNAPMAGVAVCLGTPARLNQFGAMLTDPGGYAVFSDVPQTALLVTASRAGFKAEHH